MAVSVLVRCAVPVTVGSAVTTGGADWTVAVGALGAPTVPSGLVAVMTARTRMFSSATPRM